MTDIPHTDKQQQSFQPNTLAKRLNRQLQRKLIEVLNTKT